MTSCGLNDRSGSRIENNIPFADSAAGCVVTLLRRTKMILFANIALDPATIAAWLALGLASGWLGSKLMEEPSYGTMGDLILGVIGALAGGLIYAFFRVDAGFWGSVVVALIGACTLIGGTRAIVASRSA
jgi:uncharacterized membrane protein YeaQ/YmgE (transglycosylase-associated protein family)